MEVFSIQRIVVFVILVAIVCSFIVLPGNAADLDWHDYILSVEVLESGNMSAVTLSLPVSDSMYWIYDGSDTLLNSTTGDSITQYLQASSYYMDPEYPYDIVIRPCKDDYFMLSNVPADTEVYYDWRIKYNGSVTDSELFPATGYGVGNIYYYDSRYSLLYTDSMTISGGPIPTNTLQFLANSTLRNFSSGSTDGNITDAAFMKVSFEVPDFSVTQSGNYTISLSAYRMTIFIDSLFDGSGDYTLLINAINESLVAQGKKIDELKGEIVDIQNQMDSIINGDVSPEEPSIPPNSFGEPIDDALDREEDALRDSAQSGLETMASLFNNAISLLVDFAPAFAIVSSVFALFANIPYISVLLSVSLALGITGFIFGLANTVLSRNSRDSRYSERSAGKSKIKGS